MKKKKLGNHRQSSVFSENSAHDEESSQPRDPPLLTVSLCLSQSKEAVIAQLLILLQNCCRLQLFSNQRFLECCCRLIGLNTIWMNKSLFPQQENKSLDKGRKELNIFLFLTFPVYKAKFPGLYSNITYAGFEGKFVQSLNKMAPLWLLAKHRDLEQVRMSKITMIIISWVINHLCDQYRF